ncbi:lysophospholipid acyltransferase family protein [Marinomonas algicola]|uniref:lysophospholipid acyltransferase family protein n=1 Tax=Marinomonas algicola TaxID=2773454 RepID=UPI00174CAC48|nr:lysophospholipid acyltransferase family protein [Marinomonas algicola]
MSGLRSLRGVVGSILFGVCYIVLTIVSGVISPPIALFFQPKNRQLVLNVHNAILLALFKVFCGVTIRVKGRENLVKGKPVILVANHQCEWETYFLQVLVTPLSTVLKKELLSVPFFGWGLRMVQPIAIDRAQKSNALKQILKQGKERIEDGRSVLIFPEGTRVKVGQEKEFNKGAAMLATSSNAPILPIVHNAGYLWTSKSWRKYSGVIDVVIGPEISSEGKKTSALHEEMQDWMRAEMAKLPKGR